MLASFSCCEDKNRQYIQHAQNTACHKVSVTLQCCFSLAQLCPILYPHGLQHFRFPCSSLSPSLLKLISIESVVPSNYLIICRPLFLMPSIIPSIRFLSNHSALGIGKSKALIIWTLVGKVRSLLFNTLSRFVIAFLPRSKHGLNSWLHCSDFGAQEKKVCHSSHLSPSIFLEVMGPEASF